MNVGHTCALVAALAVVSAPAIADAKTVETSFQLQQVTPNHVWNETSFMADAFPGALKRVYRYRYGGNTFVGRWFPAALSTGDITRELQTLAKDARGYKMHGIRGVVLDRALTAAEAKQFRVLVDLYRDADVLVVAKENPACTSGLTLAQARAIATGAVTQWSQVGTGSGPIRVHTLVDGFGDQSIPIMGTRWVKTRVNYPTSAKGSSDAGISLAARGDTSVASLTTWSRVRQYRGTVCAVPLNGVAADDQSISDLKFPAAFPVRYVVTKALVGRTAVDRGHVAVMRQAMAGHLRSARLKGMLRRQGVLVVGDPITPPAGTPPPDRGAPPAS